MKAVEEEKPKTTSSKSGWAYIACGLFFIGLMIFDYLTSPEGCIHIHFKRGLQEFCGPLEITDLLAIFAQFLLSLMALIYGLTTWKDRKK